MDWILKAVLTAGTVFVVLAGARRLGRRAAGVMAALPVITAPTLAWVSHEQGVRFAVSAAIGSVSATAVMAIFAVAYARGSRHGGVAIALTCGLAGALAVAVPAALFSDRLGKALALAIACCWFALASLRVAGGEARSKQRSRLAPMGVALLAGGLSAIAATIGPDLGGFATGLLSSLPLIGGGVAILEHSSGGHRAAEQFLHGYVRGLFGKTAFGATFALIAAHVGATSALLIAGLTACVFLHPWARLVTGVPSVRRCG